MNKYLSSQRKVRWSSGIVESRSTESPSALSKPRSLVTLLKRIGPLRRIVQQRRSTKRLAHSAAEMQQILKLTFRPHFDANAVIDDYLFSLKISWRHCGQVLLLEDIIRTLAREQIRGALVECGVFTGGASAYMLRSAMRNCQGELPGYWGFDSFEGMPHARPEDGAGVKWLIKESSKLDLNEASDGKLQGTDAMKADFEGAQEYLYESGYPAEKIHLIQGWFQDTLAKTAQQIGPIAILRLDGDFYESTKVSLDCLSDQVVPGGIIIFDDYGSFEGCKRAVDEFVAHSTGFSLPVQYDAHQAFMLKALR